MKRTKRFVAVETEIFELERKLLVDLMLGHNCDRIEPDCIADMAYNTARRLMLTARRLGLIDSPAN